MEYLYILEDGTIIGSINTARNACGSERCFACDKTLGKYPKRVDTRDGQTVLVGSECFKLIRDAGEKGYQPAKGGPKLYMLPVEGLDNDQSLCNCEWYQKCKICAPSFFSVDKT